MKLLLVEDNVDMAGNLTTFLTKEGYICEWAASKEEALEKIENYTYDMVLLDIMLPDGSGLDWLKKVKKQNLSQAGVIVISAKNSVPDRVQGLEFGADDYLVKPFHLSELNARIKSVYRRKHFEGRPVIEFNEIKVLMDEQIIHVYDVPIILTKKEFELLLYFLSNKNRVITKMSIAEHLWGDQVDSVDSFDFVYQHIKNLRKKLSSAGAADYLQNVYGMGYKFNSYVS